MRFIIKKSKKSKDIGKAVTTAISRRGYTVYEQGMNKYGVVGLEVQDRNVLRNMIAQLCDHYGADYEIII